MAVGRRREFKLGAVKRIEASEDVSAKIDAVSHGAYRLDPKRDPEPCTANNVLETAVVELTELRKATEA